MSESVRLDLAVVAALIVACTEPTPPKHNLEQVWASEEQVRSLRKKMYDAMGTHGAPERDFKKWLAQPEICNVSNFVTRLEMAAGTFVWPDVPQFRGEDHRDFEFLRDKWRDFVVVTLDSCDGARFGPLVRRYKREIEAAFASPRAERAIDRLLNGSEKEQSAALEIIRLAPSRVYYERVAQLARAGSVRARTAMIQIDGLWENEPLPEGWSSWLQQRLDDSSPTALADLLSVATGTTVSGAPAGEIPLEVRRVAARTARVWRETTLDGRLIADDRIVALAKDTDNVLRREGAVMLEPTNDNVDLLEVIATSDSDPRIRLIAYQKLPDVRQKRLAPEQRP